MTVKIGPSQQNKGYETRMISALGSLILDSPLVNSYPAGTAVVVYPASSSTSLSDRQIQMGMDKAQGQGLVPGLGLASTTGYTLGGLTLPSFTGTLTFMGQGLGLLSVPPQVLSNTTTFTSPNDVVLVNSFQVTISR